MAARADKRRRVVVAALGLALLVVCDQVLHRTVLGSGYVGSARIAPFDPPVFAPAQQRSLERLERLVREGADMRASHDFDAQLGWSQAPESGAGEFRYDWLGARIGTAPTPREREPGKVRVGAYGCSFTMGSEVAASESWPATLESLDERYRVCNLAMAGYGVDQALLRFRATRERLEADEVWLGFLPAASLRTTTLYRPALRHWSGSVAFKPRFQLAGGGGLELIENPARSAAHAVELLRSQAEFVQALGVDDAWVARTPAAYAPRGAHWSHHSAIARVVLTLRERGGRDPAPWLAETTSEPFQLCLRIAARMASEADAAGARFRMLVLPSREDLEQRARSGAYWDALVDAWRAEGIEVHDLSQPLVDAGALERAEFWAAGGHYAALGNRCVAEAFLVRLAGEQ